MIANDLNRPGAKQLLLSFFLSIAVIVAGFFLFVHTNSGPEPQVGGPLESVMIFCPILVAILGWQSTIGFRKLALDKGFSQQRIESLLKQGLIGFYLVFFLPADTTGATTSAIATASVPGTDNNFTGSPTNTTGATTNANTATPVTAFNSEPNLNLSTAKQVKLLLVFLVSAATFSFVLPWMLWLSNYAQAEGDLKAGNYNTTRIVFAETLLNKYPNAQDMAKVQTLKAKIYKDFADDLTPKLKNWTKKEQVERKADIDKMYVTASQASAEAAKLSNEHWGTSSSICFAAIGAFFLSMLGLAAIILSSKDN